MVAKTVYDLYWKPSLATPAVMVAAVAAIMYLPYLLQLPIFLNPVLYICAQASFCIGITMFFYAGIKHIRLFKVLMLLVLNLSIFGVVSNLFHQATFLVSSRMIASDYLIIGLINLFAVAMTLSCYRMKQNKIEIPDGHIEPVGNRYQALKTLTPVVYLLPVIGTLAVIFNSRYVPNGAAFAINVPFFIAAQIALNIGGAFFIFKEKTRREKLRLSFGVVSFAMLYGAFGNYLHQLTTLRPGLRLILNSTEFTAMNAGALITMATIVGWNKYLASEKEKYLKSSAAQSAAPPAVSPDPETPAKEVDVEVAAAETAVTTPGEPAQEERVEEKSTALTEPEPKVIKTSKKKKSNV